LGQRQVQTTMLFRGQVTVSQHMSFGQQPSLVPLKPASQHLSAAATTLRAGDSSERTVVSPPAVVSPPGARLLLAKGQLQEADPEWTPRTTALRPNSRRPDVLIWKFVPTRDSSNAFELPSDFLNAIELSNWLRKSHLVLLWKEIGTLGGIRPPNFYVLEVVKGALTYPPRCPFGHAVTP